MLFDHPGQHMVVFRLLDPSSVACVNLYSPYILVTTKVRINGQPDRADLRHLTVESALYVCQHERDTIRGHL